MIITKNGLQYIIRKNGKYWVAEYKTRDGRDITGRFLTRKAAIESTNN